MKDNSTGLEPGTRLDISSNMANDGSGGDAADEKPPYPPDNTKRRKRGRGCLLALVVLAIVVWQAVASLTLFVTNAQYAAEPIPVIGNLRTLTAVYNFELNRLPGLGSDSEGTVAVSSQLGDGLSCVQTFSGMEPAAWAADFGSVIVVTNGNHVVRELDVSAYDMMGAKSRPAHYQYRGEMREGTNYLHVVGAFGDGDGLKAGTGYAVIELVNVDAGVKAVGTWERYKPVSDPKQIVMVNAEEARKYFKCDSPEQARKMNLCWVGDTEALMSGDKVRVEKAIKELEVAGWR